MTPFAILLLILFEMVCCASKGDDTRKTGVTNRHTFDWSFFDWTRRPRSHVGSKLNPVRENDDAPPKSIDDVDDALPKREGGDKGISLFISRIASNDSSRLIELDAALAANLANMELLQTYVLLEKSSASYNCSFFLAQLRASSIDHLDRLTCVDRVEGQPTYREMYESAFTIPQRGNIVILSNADVVFDHSIKKLMGLPKNRMNVLSVTGGPHHAPPDIRRVYQKFNPEFDNLLARHGARDGSVVNYNGQKKVIPWNLCSKRWKYLGLSWDAYAFRRDSTHIHFNSSDYLEALKFRGREFFMNEMGAEHTAALAFHQSGFERRRTHRIRRRLYVNEVKSSSPNGTGYMKRWHPNNPCRFVNMWHFHLLPKTHNSSIVIQRNKWKDAGRSNICETLNECMYRTNTVATL